MVENQQISGIPEGADSGVQDVEQHEREVKEVKTNIPVVIRMLPRMLRKLGLSVGDLIAYEIRDVERDTATVEAWFEPHSGGVDRAKATVTETDNNGTPRRVYSNVQVRTQAESGKEWKDIANSDYEEVSMSTPEEYMPES